MRRALAFAIVLVTAAVSATGASTMARVGPGVVRPVYAPEPGVTEVAVPAFELDRLPVTNGDFLAFVQSQPAWRRDRAAAIFVDTGYLAQWATPASLGDRATSAQPVTHVSWFAARAYCGAAGKRLPTENEWELAAAAGREGADGRAEPGFRESILAWYARPTDRTLPGVGRQPPNFWGIHDMHGLVWEWVDDFAGTMITGDSRDGRSADSLRFCGVGAIAATDKADYASFMRVAFRSSLEARYTTANLGFRCARDVEAGR